MNQALPQPAADRLAQHRARGEMAARLFDQRRYAEAEPMLRDLVAADPRDAAALHLLGLLCWNSGRRQEGVALVQRAVAAAPGNPYFLNNLGAILFTVGNTAGSEAAVRRALQIDPKYADALCNLGNVLRTRRDLAGAFAAYSAAVQQAPGMAAAYNNLGLIHYMEGRKADAEASYRKALELDPTFPEVHNNLGNVLSELDRDDEAVAALKQAVALRPEFVEAHSNLAKVLIRKELLGEAREHLMTTLSLDPDFPGGYHNLGTLYHMEGAFAEAEGCFRKAIALDPGLHMAYAGATSTRRMTAADRPLVERLERLAETAEAMAQDERAHLHFALGKAYDDMGEYAQAFAHYRKGNTLVRDALPVRYMPDVFDARITQMIERFTPAFFERRRHAGNDSVRPIFIVGMMRSGTTLIEQIVSSHPQVQGGGELIFFAHEDARLRSDLNDPTDAELADAASRYLELLRGFSADARHVTDKMPHNFLHLALIRLVFPNARIIHSRRNPIDTCLSVYFQNFPALHPYAYDLDDMAAHYRSYRRYMAHWRQVIPADLLLEVDYEDVVADQEAQTRRMLDFCGLPWDDACLAFQQNKRAVRTASSWQVRQPLYKSSVARWKRYEAHVGPLLGLLEESS